MARPLTEAKPLMAAALAIAVLSSCGLAACETKEDTGALTGAVLGGIIGNQFGKGGGKVAATLAGAVIGGIVGSEIGRELDARDRELAREAEYDAWEQRPSRRPVRWSNADSGHRGEVVAQAQYDRHGARCRDFVHRVWIDGRKREMRGTACRNPDGTWTQVT